MTGYQTDLTCESCGEPAVRCGRVWRDGAPVDVFGCGSCGEYWIAEPTETV